MSFDSISCLNSLSNYADNSSIGSSHKLNGHKDEKKGATDPQEVAMASSSIWTQGGGTHTQSASAFMG